MKSILPLTQAQTLAESLKDLSFNTYALDFNKETRRYALKPDSEAYEKLSKALQTIETTLTSTEILKHAFYKHSAYIDISALSLIEDRLPFILEDPTYGVIVTDQLLRTSIGENPNHLVALHYLLTKAATSGVALDRVIREHIVKIDSSSTLKTSFPLVNVRLIQKHFSDLISPTTLLSALLHSYAPDKGSNIELRRQLVKEALDAGADVNALFANIKSATLIMDLCVAYELEDVLLNHPTNPLKPDLFMLSVKNAVTIKPNSEPADIISIMEAVSQKGGFNTTLAKEKLAPTEFPSTYPEHAKNFLEAQGLRCEFKVEQNTPAILLEEGLMKLLFSARTTSDLAHRHLNATPQDELKFPRKLHHIWLTNKDNPRELRPQDIENVIKTKKIFTESKKDWQHIIWVNDKSLIPESADALEKAGFSVINYHDYPELSLVSKIDSKIDEKKWGEASDALRYALIHEFGGVYADLNFEFKRHMEHEAHTYNFMSMGYDSYHLDNFFFASSPHHPILAKAIELVGRNFYNPPAYVEQEASSERLADISTAEPISTAYYLAAHQNGNIDVIYPGYNEEKEEESEKDELNAGLCTFTYAEIRTTLLKQSPFWPSLVSPEKNYGLCPTSWHIIGIDSEDGLTWLES